MRGNTAWIEIGRAHRRDAIASETTSLANVRFPAASRRSVRLQLVRCCPIPGSQGCTVPLVASAAEITEALQVVTGVLPAGEHRQGQLEMALAVGRAIASETTLMVQAGTGTGKTLAYLVPALLSGKRIVVATATKALQDQLAEHDLPLVAESLGESAGVSVEFAVLKGRSNYVCRQRLRELEASQADQGEGEPVQTDAAVEQLILDALELDDDPREVVDAIDVDELAFIRDWSLRSSTGDRAELSMEPSHATWAAVSVGPRECPGRARCPSASDCFAEHARDRASEADVVVVNQHLYGLHLASDSGVLPEHEVLIVDEAHQFEDTISVTTGTELWPGNFGRLASAVAGIMADRRTTLEILETGSGIRSTLSVFAGRRLKRPDPHLQDVLVGTAAKISRVASALRELKPTTLDAQARRDRATQLAGSLVEDLNRAAAFERGDVVWVEGSEASPVLKVAPLDVSQMLSRDVFERMTVVLTSATLPSTVGARLGAPEAGTEILDVGSPFDCSNQALLYCAAHLPDPRGDRFDEEAASEIATLVEAAGGRTLALFTSWRMLHATADLIAHRIPGRLLCQDELPKPALLREFAEDETSSLFATMGFWQGIDVPGPSLSLVVIDRIPFARPDEPLTAARREQAREKAFAAVDLPRAATLLAQGAGRLIRSSTDRGVVAVLDPRLAVARYRWTLVNALPPMQRTRDQAEAIAFLEEIKSSAAS